MFDLQARAYPRFKNLKGASLGYAPALPTNKTGWRELPGKNTQAYNKNLLITYRESFITFGPGL